ncbi:MAG: phosphotransferase family protein [Acidimicrobiia bacterium]
MAAEGIDAENVTRWFEQNVKGVKPPLDFDLIAGGRSNLTFRVTDAAGQRFVLRRPPTSHVLPTAHDMGREFRIISALQGTPVPVPPALGFCEDESVNQRPFYVMGFVEGQILRDAPAAEKTSPEIRRRIGESLVDVLAAIHAVDPDDVGLGNLAKRDGYIERQLNRWHKQFEASKTREVPVIDEVYKTLLSRIPEQGPACIVHGDYRLDNCLIGDSGEVAAVLDWELCTLGDPLADVGLLMVYWNDPDDETRALGATATTLEGFPRKNELVERYRQASGRNVSQLDFYIAFGYWKLACILNGVYTRYAAGAMGNDGADFTGFADAVVQLGEAARAAAERLAATG